MDTKFSYAAEKLGAARRILMLPHPSGEPSSLAGVDSVPVRAAWCRRNAGQGAASQLYGPLVGTHNAEVGVRPDTCKNVADMGR